MAEKKYSRSPAREVICECRFARTPVDPALAGLVFKELGDDFPIRKRRSVTLKEPNTQGKLPPIHYAQFFRKDEKVLVQVGDNSVAVSHLQPYSGWESFVPSIKRGLQAYQAVADAKEVSRVGLRYLNVFEFKEDVSLSEYFNFGPVLPEAVQLPITDFTVMCGFKGVAGGDHSRIQLRSHPEGILLDLDYFREGSVDFTVESTLAWLDAAHIEVVKLFEAVITDKTRDQIS